MNIRNFSRAAVATTIVLPIILPSGAYGCSTEQATALGCDIVLSVGAGGQPDWFKLTDEFCGISFPLSKSCANKTLCVPPGDTLSPPKKYSQLSLYYVNGAPGAPVTIINCGGQVVFDGRNSGINKDATWNTFTGKGSRYIHLSGAGDASIKYGFVMRGAKSHGVHFDEGCSDIEINNVETYENDYAGMFCFCIVYFRFCGAFN